MSALKIQTTFKTPMDASGWMKTDNIEKLVIVVDTSAKVILVPNNLAQKL